MNTLTHTDSQKLTLAASSVSHVLVFLTNEFLAFEVYEGREQ